MKRLFILILLSAALYQCEKPIELDLEEEVNLLVVDGLITNEPGPYTVYLTNTNMFGTQDRGPFEDDAIITIFDDDGNSEILSQVDRGEYQTAPDGIRGVIGRTYWITITTADGGSYRSNPELMYNVPPIDSIYTEFIETPLVPEDGHQFFIDLSDPIDEQNFYRWSWEAVTPIITTTPPRSGPLFCCNVCFQTTVDNKGYNVLSDRFINGNQIIRNPIHFAIYRNSEDYLVRVKQYSISAEAYDYWLGIQGQTESVGSIFDPPPTPIRGNVLNLMDEEKNALGYFGASAITRTKLQFDRGEIDDPIRNPLFRVGQGDCREYNNTTVAAPADWEQ